MSSLFPYTTLFRSLGCPFVYQEELGGHVPIHNEKMETPLEGIYVAGNITGIESAKVAREQGRVAGLSITKKVTNKPDVDVQLNQALATVHATRKEATIQFHPSIEAGRDNVREAYQQLKRTKE